MKRKGAKAMKRNWYTRWAVGSALVAVVGVVGAILMAKAGAYGWCAVFSGVGLLASIFCGMVLEKRATYMIYLERERELKEFLEFARTVTKACTEQEDEEPFEEFLKREEDGKSEK